MLLIDYLSMINLFKMAIFNHLSVYIYKILDLISFIMSLCLESITKNVGTTLINSAHSTFQYGQYYDCIET